MKKNFFIKNKITLDFKTFSKIIIFCYSGTNVFRKEIFKYFSLIKISKKRGVLLWRKIKILFYGLIKQE